MLSGNRTRRDKVAPWADKLDFFAKTDRPPGLSRIGRGEFGGTTCSCFDNTDTAIVEEIAVTSANIDDGRAGPDALPDNPGVVFADSDYRGSHFRDAVRAKGGVPRIVATGMWGRDEEATLAKLVAWNQPIHRVRGGSRKSSEHGNEAMACAECRGAGSPKPPAKSTSPPSLTTSNARTTSSRLPDDTKDHKATHWNRRSAPLTIKVRQNLRSRPTRSQVS